jgi:flagellar hook-associated protein 2
MAGEIFHPNITGVFDWGTLLDGIMNIESIRLKNLEERKEQLSKQLDYYNELKSLLEDLQSFAGGINKKDWFNKKTVQVDNPDVADVKIINNDIPEYTSSFTVDKTAQIEISYFSREFENLDEEIGENGSILLAYKNKEGKTYSIKINYSATNTLRDLINVLKEGTVASGITVEDWNGSTDPDNPGPDNGEDDYAKIREYLTSFAMYTGKGYRLAFMETDLDNGDYESAAGGPYTDAPGLGDYYILQAAQNSEIKVGTSTFQSTNYDFVNILPGLKITVKKPGTVNLMVKRDYQGIVDEFAKFVDKVNKVIEKINQLTSIKKEENNMVEGPKIEDTGIKMLKEKLQRLFYPLLSPSNTISKYNVIDFNNDGTISLNKTNLEKFLKENEESEWDVLYDIVEKGKELAELAVNPDGAYVGPQIKSLQNEVHSLELRIMDYQEYLQEKQEFLKRRFASIESYIAGIKDIQAKITSILATQMILFSSK